LERQTRRRIIAKSVLDRLTDIQRRRYLMYHADGLTTREIAAREGAAQRSVMDSLEAAAKKIKKVLAEA
jgi:DNA-directed RNA polymerase specialized sigma24 family protein